MNSGGSAMWRQHPVEEDEEEEVEEEAQLSARQLLQLAETHLRVRNFSLCREYALESLQSPNDSNNNLHRQASQILAISNILSSPSNYYSVLQVDTFCNDLTLIRSKYKQLLSILDPIKNNSTVANEAANLVWKAYACLSDPTTKSQFDSSASACSDSTFWSFCPYCFYVYQYARVYQGCCLRCSNQTCRRAFHGVALNSLPAADLDNGTYFSCFGYFPLGFSPDANNFHSWSPIVGMFPARRIPKTRASRLDLNHNTNVAANNSDESDNDSGARPMKRKSVAWSAKKLMSKRRRVTSNQHLPNSHADVDVDVDGFQDYQDAADDMAFFEEGGEIFVDLAPDAAAL